MGRKYFGTDGIRGTSNKFPMTPDVAMRVGMAAGVAFRRGEHRHRVVIGKDTRLSGYMIENALVAGFTAAGMDTLLLGPLPTPAVAMLTRSMRADIGVMISASHNQYQDNGIKLFGPDGFKLSDKIEESIERLIEEDLSGELAKSDDIGRATRLEGVHARYIEYVKRTLPRQFSFEGIRVVIDCANGAAYKVAPEALWELGADVVPLGVKPNGTNINEDCGSTSTAELQRRVLETRADIGIALDGDADRVIIVDQNGKVIDGDQIMAVVSDYWNSQERLAGGGVVATVMSNLGLERFLTDKGLLLARTKVGDRYVVEHMRNHGFNLGGEQSGHMIMSDFATTGDGLIAALQVMAVVQSRNLPVSDVCRKFEPVPQIMKNVRYSEGDPLANDKVKEAIRNAEHELGKSGRLVIRASGTEPLIRVMAEGDDEQLVDKVVDGVVGVVRQVAA